MIWDEEEEDLGLSPEVKLRVHEQKIDAAHKKIDVLTEKVERIYKEIFKPAELGPVEALRRTVYVSKNYKVKDMSLAAEGKLQIEWAEQHMPVLIKIRERFAQEKPLAGITIAACLHVTKETAVLAKTLKAGGATVALCGSNPLSTQDAIAAALADEGINVFAWRGVNNEEYYWCINQVLDFQPDMLIDDGADLISTAHQKNKFGKVICSLEETTTGVNRLKSMENNKALKFPVIAVNNAHTKMLIDNVYGTGQSTIDGILRATGILLAGKTFVVCGYGNCGKGLAKRANGMGCKVIVTEVDPRRALQAFYDGYQVMSMNSAAKVGDVFVTVTGNRSVIREEHFKSMKSGAILANSGHFNVEIDVENLEKISIGKKKVKENVEEYQLKDGRKIYLLAAGRLVNLAAASGHPSEVMQTSFANQALCAEHAIKNKGNFENIVYDVPENIDMEVAKLCLESYSIQIDKITEEQVKYITSWAEGT